MIQMAPRNATAAGQAALVGWRAKVADGLAEPMSRRLPLTDEQVRALVGGLFFALSLVYVIGTIKRLLTR
jgi:hypothetical protein